MALKSNILKIDDFLNPLLSKKNVSKQNFEIFQTSLQAYIQEINSQHTSKQSEPNIVSNALKPFVESFGYKLYNLTDKEISVVENANKE